MIWRRLTVICKLAIFQAEMGLSEDSMLTIRALKIKTIRLAENDNSAVCVSIMQIRYLLGRNGIMSEFHRKTSKMAL